MENAELQKMISHRGFKVLSNTAELTGSFMGFSVWSDTVISALEINKEAVNLSDYGLNSIIIPQGALVYFAEHEIITSITLASGTIYLLKTK